MGGARFQNQMKAKEILRQQRQVGNASCERLKSRIWLWERNGGRDWDAQRLRSAPRATSRNLKTPSRFVARVRWNELLGKYVNSERRQR